MFSIWKRHKGRAERDDGLRVVVGLATDVGQIRSENQDALVAVPEAWPRLVMVADGMGGHEDGAVASRLAVEKVVEALDAGPANAQTLQGAIEYANAAVWGAANGQDAGRRMGTTCTALLITPAEMVLGHVGDSRAYRVGPGELEQLSIDHTVAAEMQASGMLSEEEADRHPQRHALTRALGTAEWVDATMISLGRPRSGDRFVICSDGLAPVPMHEVWQTASNYEPQEAAEWLVTRANALGGPDNISVAIVDIEHAP